MFNRGFIASFSTFFGDPARTVRASGIYRGQGLSFAFLRIVFGFTALFASSRLSCLQWILQSRIRRLELHEGFIWVELAEDIVLEVCGSPRIWILLIAAIASHRICRVGLFTSYLAILDFRLLELCKGIIVVTS